MKIKFLLISLTLASAMYAASAPRSAENASTPAMQKYAAQTDPDSESLRLQGEQRFRANCGRCHSAPHKFPPRMMTTIVRHMRVRATITDEDMKLILRYMTE
jgi:mono/diheme cytochrome c family protein